MMKAILLIYFATSVFAHAESPDFEIAKKIILNGNGKGALACMTCHQLHGAGNAAAGFPQLAGMNAAYFTSMPTVANASIQAPQSNFELGKTIAEKGLWDKGMPSCFSCHGPSGRGVGENFPGITTQGKTYLVQQLQAWKKGTRKNDPNQLMATVAKKLTAKEMDSVTEYLTVMKSEVPK